MVAVVVDVEITAKVIKATINEAENILKQVTAMALYAGNKRISRANGIVSDWRSVTASKTKDINEGMIYDQKVWSVVHR